MTNSVNDNQLSSNAIFDDSTVIALAQNIPPRYMAILYALIKLEREGITRVSQADLIKAIPDQVGKDKVKLRTSAARDGLNWLLGCMFVIREPGGGKSYSFSIAANGRRALELATKKAKGDGSEKIQAVTINCVIECQYLPVGYAGRDEINLRYAVDERTMVGAVVDSIKATVGKYDRRGER